MGKKYKRKQQGGRRKSQAEYWWRGGGGAALPSEVPYGVGFDPRVSGKSYKEEVGKNPGGQYGSYFKHGLPSTYKGTTSKRYELGSKFLTQGWYKPYMKAAVADPLGEMAQVRPGGETPGAQDLRQFTKVSDPGKQFMGQAYGVAESAVGGASKAILPTDPAFESKFAAKKAERTFGQEEHVAKMEAQDVAEKEAKDVRKGAKLSAAIERKKLGVDVAGKRLSSEAAEGAAGFAYSGPQERAQQELSEAGAASFADISRGESKAEKAYTKSIDDIELERETAERDWKSAELGYATDIQSIYSDAGNLLEGVRGKIGDIMRAHRSYGSSGAGRGVGAVGAFGGDSFGEVDLPEQKEYEQRVGESEAFMNQLQQAQAGIISDIASGYMPDDSLYETEGDV